MKCFLKFAVCLVLLAGNVSSHAADTFDAATNILSISLVKAGDTFYADVKIKLGDVISLGSQTGAVGTYDTYDSSNRQLWIPEVGVGSKTYYNVVITVGDILFVGASCTTAAQCGAGNSTTDALYYGPAQYSSAIADSYTPGIMSLASSFTNRSRYLLSNAASQTASANYMQVGFNYDADTGFDVEAGTLATSTIYYQYLQKLIQVVADSSGYYRLESSLHPNNAIDFVATDGNKLKFRNNFGKAAVLYGYVTFAYDSKTKLLQAKKRYKYAYTTVSEGAGTTHAVSYTEDTAFSAANYYVNLSDGVYKLVASSAVATPLYAYNSLLDLGIPEFLNPQKVPFVTNDPAPFLSKNTVVATEGTSGSIYKQVNSTYRNQVATPGVNASTKTSADAMLASIKSAVEGSGEKLRYATALYSAYRDATLAHKLVSDSIADGTPGQNLVPYVYFTNEKDSAGKYHPFMVVVNYGNQASPNGLKDVPHPPGKGTGSYLTSQVTRFSNLENYVTRIPMKDYGLVSNVTENIFTRNLWTDRTTTSLKADVYTYADAADNGLLIDGSVMFPVYNNNLVPSNLFGELSASGCHVGQGGGGPHCHFDGYQSGFSLGVYGDADYVNKTHPPMIGFGYDGIVLFGKYRSNDTAMKGYNTALDSFGGHNHDGIGYHYHSHNVYNHKAELTPYTTTLNVLMKGAYIGKTNDIPYFRASSSFSTNKYLGGTVK